MVPDVVEIVLHCEPGFTIPEARFTSRVHDKNQQFRFFIFSDNLNLRLGSAAFPPPEGNTRI